MEALVRQPRPARRRPDEALEQLLGHRPTVAFAENPPTEMPMAPQGRAQRRVNGT